MLRLGDGVEGSKHHAADQHDGGHRPNQQAQGEERAGRLFDSGLTLAGDKARVLEHDADHKLAHRQPKLLQQHHQPVEDALAALPRLQLVKLNHVGHHTPRHDVGGCHTNPGQHRQHQRQRTLVGLHKEERRLHANPEDHADHVDGLLADVPTDRIPDEEEDERRALDGQDHQPHQVGPLEPEGHIMDENGRGELHRQPREEVDADHEEVGPVAERRAELLNDILVLHIVGAVLLAGARHTPEKGQHGQAAPDRARDQIAGDGVGETPHDEGVQHPGDDAAANAEGEAEGVEARALIVVLGQFGGERGVRHVHGGEGDVEEQPDNQVVDELAGVVEGRDEPLQKVDQAEGHRAIQHPGASSSQLRARAVREPADHRVIHRIPDRQNGPHAARLQRV